MTREEILKDKARYDAIAEYNKPIMDKYNESVYGLIDRFTAKYREAFGIGEEEYRVDINRYFYGDKDRIVTIEKVGIKDKPCALRWDIRVNYDDSTGAVSFESNSWSGANLTSLESVDDLVETAGVIEKILKYPDYKVNFLEISHELSRYSKERDMVLQRYPDDLRNRNFERELKDLEYTNLQDRLFNGNWYKLYHKGRYSDKESLIVIFRVNRHTDKTVWYDVAREYSHWDKELLEYVKEGRYYVYDTDNRCLISNFSYDPYGAFKDHFDDGEEGYRYEACGADFKPDDSWRDAV